MTLEKRSQCHGVALYIPSGQSSYRHPLLMLPNSDAPIKSDIFPFSIRYSLTLLIILNMT